MREPQTIVLAGRTYSVTPLPAGKGLAILTLLTKTLARGLENVPSLAELATYAGTALADVAGHLEEAHVDRLCRTLTESAMFEIAPGTGRMVPLKDHFEHHFAGNYGELGEFLRFALEVNYGSFLGVIRSAAANAPAPSASPAASA